jgi:hypothetical protein
MDDIKDDTMVDIEDDTKDDIKALQNAPYKAM